MWQQLERDYRLYKSPDILAKKYGVHRKTVVGHLKASGLFEKQTLDLAEVKRLYQLHGDIEHVAYELKTYPSTVRAMLQSVGARGLSNEEQQQKKLDRLLARLTQDLFPGAVYMPPTYSKLARNVYDFPNKKTIGIAVDRPKRQERKTFHFVLEPYVGLHHEWWLLGFDSYGRLERIYLMPTEAIGKRKVVHIPVTYPNGFEAYRLFPKKEFVL